MCKILSIEWVGEEWLIGAGYSLGGPGQHCHIREGTWLEGEPLCLYSYGRRGGG